MRGQRSFFEIRVFDLNARRYRNQELAKCYETNEKEKKRQYNERVLQIENGIYTPLVFSTEQKKKAGHDKIDEADKFLLRAQKENVCCSGGSSMML